MPRTTVTAIARMNAVRSSRRIAQTANWQVNELDDQQDRAPGTTSGRIVERWNGMELVSGLIGGHCAAFARTLK